MTIEELEERCKKAQIVEVRIRWAWGRWHVTAEHRNHGWGGAMNETDLDAAIDRAIGIAEEMEGRG